MRSGDVATWVAAVGTAVAALGAVGALFLALYQVGTERRHRLEQERRAAQEADRAQADQISAWFVSDSWGRRDRSLLGVLNMSPQPIYQVVVTLTLDYGQGEDVPEEYRAIVPTLVHGDWRVTVAGGWRGMMKYATVEIGFTDHRGDRHWIRRADGRLESIPVSAIEHYDVYVPFPATIPVAASEWTTSDT